MNNAIAILPSDGASPKRLIAAGVRDANRAWRSGRDRYIETMLEIARHVCQVWDNCQHEKVSFRSLFQPDAEVAFEFDRAKAKMFLAIGKNPALMSGQHAAHLPTDYTILGKLAQLPAPKLKQLIENETITPTMRRAEVAALVNHASPAKRKPRVTQRAVNDELDQAYEALRQRLLKMPRDRMIEVLRSLADDCGASEILK